MIPIMQNSRKGKTTVIAWVWGLGKGLTTKGHEKILQDEGTVPYLDCTGRYKVYTFTKIH